MLAPTLSARQGAAFCQGLSASHLALLPPQTGRSGGSRRPTTLGSILGDVEASKASKAEPKAEPKPESKPEPKAESKAESKASNAQLPGLHIDDLKPGQAVQGIVQKIIGDVGIFVDI